MLIPASKHPIFVRHYRIQSAGWMNCISAQKSLPLTDSQAKERVPQYDPTQKSKDNHPTQNTADQPNQIGEEFLDIKRFTFWQAQAEEQDRNGQYRLFGFETQEKQNSHQRDQPGMSMIVFSWKDIDRCDQEGHCHGRKVNNDDPG